MKFFRRKIIIFGIAVFLVLQAGGFDALVNFLPIKLKQALEQQPWAVQPARASGRFSPTGGNLVNGTTLAITSGSTIGNTGSWKGTLALETATEGLNWSVSSSATGLDQQVQIDGVLLQGANQMAVTINASSGAASLTRYYQICDWISTTAIDESADANCTGGGWRTINKVNNGARAPIAEAAQRTYAWNIFDGYWNIAPTSTSNTTATTPLSNFIASSNGRVLLRAYSTSTTPTTHSFNFVTIDLVVDPIYSPAGLTVITGNNTGNSAYVNAENPPTLISGTNTTGSDNLYAKVSGTASIISDFYFKFTKVETYTGMNTILVAAEHSCSATGINYRPKIYNFSTDLWEDLTTSNIACSATDATNIFAKNNVTISNYVSSTLGGEVRVGWYGLANGTQEIRLDYIYIIMGTTNSDSNDCEISFGTGVATQCANTRDIDTTLASSSDWMITSELESTNMSHDYYGYDNDADAVSGEAGNAENIGFSVALPHNTTLVAVAFAERLLPGSATASVQPGLRDYTGTDSYQGGGWVNFSDIVNSSTTYRYYDAITFGYIQTTRNMHKFIDTYNDKMSVRFGTEDGSTLLANYIRNIDFIMVSPRWVYATPVHPTLRYRYVPTGGNLVNGTTLDITSGGTTGNTGSWKATIAYEALEGYNWSVSSSATGLDQQLQFDGVALQGANQMIINLHASSGAASLTRYYQICDWVSATAIDESADANCTGGGWRTLNKVSNGARAAIAEAAQRTYMWNIYDGYWNVAPTSTSNTTATTPLSNFIASSNGRVLLRAYSTSTTPTTHMIDYAVITLTVSPIYSPAGLTVITGNNTGNSAYVNAENPPRLISGTNTTGSDNLYAKVSGTASIISDFYFKFTKVETYTGMNTILVAAEHGCSATGINYRPKIYNFSTDLWEDLTTSNIACSATDATNYFAKNNVTISNYVSSTLGGEVRVGWYGLANGTQEIRLDYIYIIMGTTNSDSSQCAIDFGTGTAANCANTRDIDTTATVNDWQVTTELESTAMSHDYYGQANDNDAVSGEANAAADVDFSITAPTSTSIANLVYAMRWYSGGTGITTQGQFRDYSGIHATISGGWNNFGTTNAATTTYTYEDPIANTNGYYLNTPHAFIDKYNNEVKMRFRTTTATYLSNFTGSYDFMMASISWVKADDTPDLTMDINETTVAMGTVTPGTPVTPSSVLTITTTNSTGYVVTAKRNDSDTTLDLITDATINITDKTAWEPPLATTTAGNAAIYSGTGLAFRIRAGFADQHYSTAWWGIDNGSNALYAGFPTTDQIIGNSSVAASTGAGMKIGYILDVPSTQKSGDYDGTITYTATVNP